MYRSNIRRNGSKRARIKSPTPLPVMHLRLLPLGRGVLARHPLSSVNRFSRTLTPRATTLCQPPRWSTMSWRSVCVVWRSKTIMASPSRALHTVNNHTATNHLSPAEETLPCRSVVLLPCSSLEARTMGTRRPIMRRTTLDSLRGANLT